MGVRRQRPNKENSAVCGPFSSSEGGVSDNRTAWLTWEDSNFGTPISKNAFEMSAEFPLFWPKTRLGDFCSCKLWKWADAETVKTSECVPLHRLKLAQTHRHISRAQPRRPDRPARHPLRKHRSVSIDGPPRGPRIPMPHIVASND